MAKAHRTPADIAPTHFWLLGAMALGLFACQQEAGASSKVEVQKASLEQKSAAPAAPEEGKAPGEGTVPAKAEEATAAAPATSPSAGEAESPTASPDSPSGAKRSLVVEQDAFRIWLEAPEQTLKAGEKATLQAVLEAKGTYHCNAEYPHKFKLDPAPATLSYPAPIAKGMKVSEKRGVLGIEVEGKSPGEGQVSGNLMFSVCTDERCLVEKQPLTLALRVE